MNSLRDALIPKGRSVLWYGTASFIFVVLTFLGSLSFVGFVFLAIAVPFTGAALVGWWRAPRPRGVSVHVGLALAIPSTLWILNFLTFILGLGPVFG